MSVCRRWKVEYMEKGRSSTDADTSARPLLLRAKDLLARSSRCAATRHYSDWAILDLGWRVRMNLCFGSRTVRVEIKRLRMMRNLGGFGEV